MENVNRVLDFCAEKMKIEAKPEYILPCHLIKKEQQCSRYVNKETEYVELSDNVKSEPEDNTLDTSTLNTISKVKNLIIKKEVDDVGVKLVKTELVSEECDLQSIKSEIDYLDGTPCNSKQYKVSVRHSKTNIWKKRTKKKRYPCLICLKSFPARCMMGKHFNQHFGNNCIVCRLCGKTFIQKKLYLNHYFDHIIKTSKPTQTEHDINLKYFKIRNVETDVSSDTFNVEVFKCEICSECFVDKKYFDEHLRGHTNENSFECSRGEKRFPCKICSKQFTRKWSLQDHMRGHAGEKSFTCKICSKKFVHKSSLMRHEHLHTGEKRFKCGICFKLFIYKSTLTSHVLWHTGEKPFKCDLCGKRFAENRKYKRHLHCHTGEKPFTCNVCFKKFAHKTGLTSHRVVHTGEKPFTCTVCSKKFGHKSNVKDHMLLHTSKNAFKCTICLKQLSSKSNLNSHMYCHTDDKPFKCEICFKPFTTKGVYRRHLLGHSGANLKIKSECSHLPVKEEWPV